MRLPVLLLLSALHATALLAAPSVPVAVTTDPPPDPKFPARMEVLHVPSGDVQINGVAYVPSGRGPHPAFVFFHGLPGNERNLDLAQAVRRAGWIAVTVNYRASWGSPGNFRFAQNLEDAAATLAYIRSPDTAKRLSIDVDRIAIGGHSMGGWVTGDTLARDPKLMGGVLISPGDIGRLGLLAQHDRAAAVAFMNDNRESLAGVTGESMTDEVMAHGPDWSFEALAPELVHRKILVLYGNDLVKGDAESLIKHVRAAGGTSIAGTYVVTDHSWSDHHIALESLVIRWLGGCGHSDVSTRSFRSSSR